MKIALVHDYLNEWGGAEVVLKTLSEIWPEAPIYTAFAVPGSTTQKEFTDRRVVTSWMQWIPGYKYLYSPLRFLIPWVWKYFDLKEYDVIVSSASWFVTKGFTKKPGGVEICYCHTPPRWLYGYETAVNWKKWRIVRVYAAIVGHFLRMYDFNRAQKVDVFVANSKNVAERIRKFYRRESIVIYPPVLLVPPFPLMRAFPPNLGGKNKEGYYLMVTRIVGGKGIEMVVEAAEKYGFKLKIAGELAGYSKFEIRNLKFENVEYLGRVSEEEKYRLMAGAKAFLALSRDEDFGITPVEAQACGTPVIAYSGGGYRETIINGKTGILFDDYSCEGLFEAIKRCSNLKFEIRNLKNNAARFSEERFKKEMLEIVNKYARAAGSRNH
jgi:glycosyltransferase involved in cell wall biosynthesis